MASPAPYPRPSVAPKMNVTSTVAPLSPTHDQVCLLDTQYHLNFLRIQLKLVVLGAHAICCLFTTIPR